jgi:hypothetical protein
MNGFKIFDKRMQKKTIKTRELFLEREFRKFLSALFAR